MILKITLTIENPATGESRVIMRLIDPANFPQTKWNQGYNLVNPLITGLVAAAVTSEAPTW